jgi:hypothetical protein
MKSKRWAVAAALLGAAVLAAGAAAEDEPDKTKPAAPGRARAEIAVKAEMEKLKGGHGSLRPIKHEALDRALPGHFFFAVIYRRFPAPQVPPAGLKASNVLAFSPEGQVHVLSDVKAVEKYFKARVALTKTDEQVKDAVRGWLCLSQQLLQDGRLRFAVPEGEIKIAPITAGKLVVGKAEVTRGGSGHISARMVFNDKGKLTMVSEDAKVRPGPRVSE